MRSAVKASSAGTVWEPTPDIDKLAYFDDDPAGVGGVTEVNRRRARLYIPAFVVAAVTICMAVAGAHDLGNAGTLFAAVWEGWARMLGPVVLGFVAAVLLLERVHPAVRRPFLTRGHFQDFVYLTAYAAVVVPLIIVIDLGFSLTLQHAAPWLSAPNLGHVPRLAILVLAVLLMDAFNWLAHWSNHRWGALWRFHAVHHSQEELSVLTSFRAHPLVHTSFLISVIPVVVLSSNATIPATVITVYICLSSLPHANLPWTFGPVGKVIVSPAYHRLHHASTGRIDLNLGSVFTIWDVVTRRAAFPVRGAEPIATGLHRRPVPIEQARPAWEPLHVLGLQLADPFLVVPGRSVQPPAEEEGGVASRDELRTRPYGTPGRLWSAGPPAGHPGVSGTVVDLTRRWNPEDRPLGGRQHAD